MVEPVETPVVEPVETLSGGRAQSPVVELVELPVVELLVVEPVETPTAGRAGARWSSRSPVVEPGLP